MSRDSSWKKLTEKNKERICSRCPEQLYAKKELDKIISKYGFIDYAAVSQGCPVLYVLKHGNMKGSYNNPRNKQAFFKNYGRFFAKKITFPLIDHAYYFRTAERHTFLVSNTYLSVKEIEEELRKVMQDSASGDFSDIRYEIIENSFYSESTNMVIIYSNSPVLKKEKVRVTAAIIKSYTPDNQPIIFATQRGYGDFAGGWEFPGGKIEEGETPQEALVREIKEELDTKIKVGDLIDTIEYDYPTFHLSMDCFWCEIVSGDLVLKEHEAAKWLTKDALDSVEWLPADVTLIAKIKTLL